MPKYEDAKANTLMECEYKEKCSTCGEPTYFLDYITESRCCSSECMTIMMDAMYQGPLPEEIINREFYGIQIATKWDTPFKVGSVFKLSEVEIDTDYYRVLEGYCDGIKKIAIAEISEQEYSLLRSVHNDILKNIEHLNKDAQEIYGEMYHNRHEGDEDGEETAMENRS